ncbi:MAG: PqqD family peptide modification chaperone [Bacteroidales bacterium]|nr:PqqD family peptide modification chaperone [Bacteroidales bacterium]
MSRNTEKINLLNVIPLHDDLVVSSVSVEGNIILSYPRFRNRWMQKYLTPKKKNFYFTVELEKYGTMIWQLIDGQHTVADIMEQMLIEFKDEPQIEDRVLKYIIQLHKDKFIKLYSSIK